MLSGFLSYSQVGISISPALAWDKTKVIGIGLGSAAGTNFGASVGVTYKAGITDQIAIQPDLHDQSLYYLIKFVKFQRQIHLK